MSVEWMAVLSAAAVLLLIVFIVFILLRANHDLARAQEEGEHFVDEWAEREEKLEEMRRRRKAREEQLLHLQEQKQQVEKNFVLHNSAQKNSAEENSTGRSSIEEKAIERSSIEENYIEENYMDRSFLEMNSIEGRSALGDSAEGNAAKVESPCLVLAELDSSMRVLRRITVDHTPFRIGRSGENDLVLEDLCVSRQHISIEERQGQYVAVDLGTRNKIFSDGRLLSHLVLEPGLHFFVGNVELMVEMRK